MEQVALGERVCTIQFRYAPRLLLFYSLVLVSDDVFIFLNEILPFGNGRVNVFASEKVFLFQVKKKTLAVLIARS